MDVSFEDSNCSQYDLNSSIQNLGCSPLKLVAQRDRIGYGKRKLVQLTKITQNKMANALGVDAQVLNEKGDNSEQCCDSKQDLGRLMELVKLKFDVSSVSEKLKLLTLVPDSWSIEKTQAYFSTSQRSVKTARELKKSFGILAEPSKKEGKTISDEVKERVRLFYTCDEYSRMCPGKKEFVSVKVDGVKQHIQKRLLLVNLKELHLEFINKHEDTIGFSKFCELRPKWCIPVGGASGLHSVCVCEYHQNFKLLVSEIPGVSDYKDLLQRIVCNTEQRDCMLHSCDRCPGSTALKDHLIELFNENNIDQVTFNQWTKANCRRFH